jgi:general secretion pathway protein G
MRKKSFGAGFTLLEILVVLVIIGLLASLVGPRLFTKVDESKVQTARVQVKYLRGALDTFRLHIGRYPTESEGLAILTTAPADEKLKARWRGPYLDEGLPADPWGNAYQYGTSGADGQPVAVYSLGADGKRGGEGYDADIGTLPAGPAK